MFFIVVMLCTKQRTAESPQGRANRMIKLDFPKKGMKKEKMKRKKRKKMKRKEKKDSRSKIGRK